jgi:D-beta-D-heptose 7-phosphate kinase/D-beta-D-heptose 1-phosphate adenosyltransferase
VVTNAEVVASRCAALRKSGRRVVFTNGVFDLFHVGHLRLLQAARALGDVLVVGINGDESARRLKGRARPVVPQFARAQIVAGARGVDLCAIFSQDDPRELLRLVHPDILVKGSEYALADVVGADLVTSWGGEVRLVPHISGWSSTRVVKKAQGEGR